MCVCVYVRIYTHGLPWWFSGKESHYNAGKTGDVGLIPRWGKILWRRAWQPTPAFLPEEFHRQRSLVGYSPQSHKVSDTTKVTEHAHMYTHTHTHTHMIFTHTHTYIYMIFYNFKCFKTFSAIYYQ